jgi:hypothetical protein
MSSGRFCTKSLQCQIALSGFVGCDSGIDTSQISSTDASQEVKDFWRSGKRITVFGEANSGVSSFCNMFCDVTAKMSTYRKVSKVYEPLVMKLHFICNGPDHPPLVCNEIDGIGHSRNETRKPLDSLLPMFPTWRFLSDIWKDQSVSKFGTKPIS